MLRRGLYASPDFLKDHPPISRPIELATLPCLLIGPAADAHRWMLRSGTSVEEVDIKGPISCNTPGMVLQLATAGLGIAVIDATMASAYVRRKELKPVLTDWEVSPSPIYVVAPGKIETLKVRLFVDHLHRSLRNFATRSED